MDIPEIEKRIKILEGKLASLEVAYEGLDAYYNRLVFDFFTHMETFSKFMSAMTGEEESVVRKELMDKFDKKRREVLLKMEESNPAMAARWLAYWDTARKRDLMSD